MTISLLDETNTIFDGLDSARVTIKQITSPDSSLEAAYRLLKRLFDPEVLDDYNSYLEELSHKNPRERSSYSIYMAAFMEVDSQLYLVGFHSSTVMQLISHPDTAIQAVAYVVTSPRAKEAGLRGIGSRLSEAALHLASEQMSDRGCRLAYVVAEAETPSLGFWNKSGFLWPEGVRYLQPPLDFDERGEPKFREVEENLVLLPLGISSRKTIECDVLRNLIRTIYENWFLNPHREILAHDARLQMQSYVLDNVFERVNSTIPVMGEIPLVSPLRATAV
jgi:hypothetical protein